MEPLAVAQRYFDAWNARDPDAIAATFTAGGTYTDPNVPDGVDARGTAEYAGGLFASFPDLRFDLESIGITSEGLVAAQWQMRGTNTETFRGLPPTGREISLPGSDFIEVEGDGVRSVRGYFDGATMVRQLGLDVIVQPSAIGPFTFGTSTYVSKRTDLEPGAMSLTVVEVRSDEEKQRVREFSRGVAMDMLQMPGFIGWVGAVAGSRMFTITAWEDAESIGQLQGSEPHRGAMAAFFGPDFTRGGQTGVWAPDRLNGLWVRCDSCGEMVRAAVDGACRCGAQLPAAPSWW